MESTIIANEIEKIVCPNCDAVQLAEVVLHEDDPCWVYVHHCANCGYIILESEWELAE